MTQVTQTISALRNMSISELQGIINHLTSRIGKQQSNFVQGRETLEDLYTCRDLVSRVLDEKYNDLFMPLLGRKLRP